MYSVLTNISQLGDLTPEIPLPIPRHILTPTDLSMGIQEEAKELLNKAETPRAHPAYPIYLSSVKILLAKRVKYDHRVDSR